MTWEDKLYAAKDRAHRRWAAHWKILGPFLFGLTALTEEEAHIIYQHFDSLYRAKQDRELIDRMILELMR